MNKPVLTIYHQNDTERVLLGALYAGFKSCSLESADDNNLELIFEDQ
jgi:hypothetical protein